tara:strand:- start:161 stop:382 length:222 start_codon:yes stop_codon:yes gene_type:complete
MKSVAPQNGPLAMSLSSWHYDPNKQGIEGDTGAGRKEVILPVPLGGYSKASPYGCNVFNNYHLGLLHLDGYSS